MGAPAVEPPNDSTLCSSALAGTTEHMLSAAVARRERAAGALCGPGVRLNKLFLSHPVSFPFLFSLQHPLFSSLFSRGNHQIFRALSRV